MTQAPGVYKPEHEDFQSGDGTWPITSTKVNPDAKENCYTYTAATSAPITLAPTRKPTTMGKSSKGTKTTKGPSAKSAKGSKRV